MIEIFITFAAFILAFFALINRIIIFRLNASILSMKRLLLLLIVMGLIALINAAISSIFLNESLLVSSTARYYDLSTSTNYISYIYQIIVWSWNAILVALVSYLFYKLITPIKFNPKKSKVYFEECSLIIASGVDADIQRLTAEIFYSVPLIFDYAFKDETDTGQYAASLIVLFSDEMFCKKMVNHNPATLYIIFETVINNCDRFQPLGKNLINKLLSLMFTEPGSQLNREDPYHGLGQFGTFKKLIFSNVNFLRSAYHPLSRFSLSNISEFDAKCIDKYFEIIEYSLKIYLNGHDNSPTIFSSALDVVVEIIRKNICFLAHKSDKDIHLTDPYNNVITCSVGLSSLIHFIQSNDQEFPKANEVIDEGYSFFKNDRNIHGAIAHGVYDVIELLSTNEYFFESIRILLVEIYQISSGDDSPPLLALQERLNTLLSNKINDNLTKLYYPAVTASLIYAFGLCEPEKSNVLIQKVLLTELKQKYLSAYESNSEIALDMLPKDTEVDVSLKKLIRKHPFQWLRYKTLQELSLDSH